MSDEDCKPQNPSDDDGRGETEEESDENNHTRIKLQAHGLSVEAESEDASFDEIAEVLTDEFDKIRRDALVGEYQQLEEKNLHSVLLGRDD